jgi:cytochrome c oxidase subunit III
MHRVVYSGFFSISGLCCLSHTAFYRFSDTLDEATNSGYHTRVVRKGLRSGSLLFTVSETMLFLGFFRAFSYARISPTAEVGYIFPPEGISIIEA